MQSDKISLEIRRKIFHTYSLIFPIAYLFLTKDFMSIAMLLITTIVILIDTFRHYNVKIQEIVDFFLKSLQRQQEKSGLRRLSGASYMALGFLITALIFSKELAITSWFILIISDAIAAIIGIKYGTALTNGKSYIGSWVFFISTVFISMNSYYTIGYNTNFIIIIISSILTTLVEFHSKRININDNLSIPITYALSTMILN